MLAGHHHEKWDGSGYPAGLKGEDIHIYGRIGALADVFDALGSKRCYKEPWTMEQILTFIKDQSGSHFEPKLVDWVLGHVDELVKVKGLFPDDDE
jgi:response regulator RpfG family c-di-GMP phosphodiesterase